MSHKLHLTSVGDPQMVGEIVEGFRLGLCELGYDVSWKYAQIDASRVNIIMFGAASLQWNAIAHLAPNCIVVNIEQLVEGGNAFNPTYLEVLRNSYVWEYSELNFRRYAELEISHASLVPLGHQAGAILVPPEPEIPPVEDIDVLFFGSLNTRRHRLLDELRARGLQLVAHHSIPAEERSALLLRSKLMLNVSYLDTTRTVELPRLAVGFVARKAILTEIYDDSELRAELRQGLFCAPYEELADTAVRLISEPAARRERADLGHRLFTAKSQASFIQPALEQFFAWRDNQVAR
ncbi:hypothetical protein M2282_004876 [Variovorax boronicumulans]|uniref:hypothetical protein n=1 Tax=Variovorax boronicumulans TaxID=436515 RepID=UPI00247350B5|nr:hypothetical protein [Variovorax boronicumulans]MDH6169707.1 hypothetical protein [Variovorax boronicumulans]